MFINENTERNSKTSNGGYLELGIYYIDIGQYSPKKYDI